MRVLIDYRPALCARTGVGEYVHQLVRALAPSGPLRGTNDEVWAFTSSWRDRLSSGAAAELGAVRIVDRRIPVRLLNFCWQRLGWPPVEILAGRRFDVVHSPHPLRLPARHAAQVVTIHDLDFLAHPERVHREIRRDYPRLAREHAHRADRVIVPSRYTAAAVTRLLEVPADRISVCPHGAPNWEVRNRPPRDQRYVLFVGTLDARKNIGGLLAGYAKLLQRDSGAPDLVLAGKSAADADAWLSVIRNPPLSGKVRHLGYVSPDDRPALYAGARLLVLPSFDEGFGLPVLEAMASGVPVVASHRGALPEVLGDAGALIEPDDVDELASAMERMLTDEAHAEACAARGRERARAFTWEASAIRTREAYDAAITTRRARAL